MGAASLRQRAGRANNLHVSHFSSDSLQWRSGVERTPDTIRATTLVEGSNLNSPLDFSTQKHMSK